MIATWWADLSPVMKLLWGVTLTATLIFIIQTVMTFLGADADSTDFDMDVDTSMDGSDLSNIDSGANLYTFRNFVNFFLGFGWTAIILQPSVKSTAVLVIIAVLVGIALVALVMYMFKWLYSMQQSGNINVYKSAVGCQGKCYLRIPGERGGEGKVARASAISASLASAAAKGRSRSPSREPCASTMQSPMATKSRPAPPSRSSKPSTATPSSSKN